MTASVTTNQVGPTISFLGAARRYWLSVFPAIRRETRRWHESALRIPDPVLRRLALEAQRSKRGNIEGSAAFAAFAPRQYRTEVVQAQVAFQSIYDYTDTLAEQPCDDPLSNAHRLHQALLDTLETGTRNSYYSSFPHQDDGGYLTELIYACRRGLSTLPSLNTINGPARRAAERIVAYQSLNLTEHQGGHQRLERWALSEPDASSRLRWWETAASAGSSLGLFALIAAAGQPELTASESLAIEKAYWPWIGALHSLLDSLIDEAEDTAAGQHSLLHYYTGPEEAASRLHHLTTESLHALEQLPHTCQHFLVLTGMVSHYLSAPEASSYTGALASERIIETLGDITRPTMWVMQIRRTVNRIVEHGSRRPKRIR